MKNFPKTIPVFPLSNFIIFPKTTVPLNIFEERYLNMVDDAMKSNKFIGMIQPVKLKNENNDQPDFAPVGWATPPMISLGDVPTSMIFGRAARYSFTPERFSTAFIKSITEEKVSSMSC